MFLSHTVLTHAPAPKDGEGAAGSGGQHKLIDGDAELQIVADCTEEGMGIVRTTLGKSIALPSVTLPPPAYIL